MKQSFKIMTLAIVFGALAGGLSAFMVLEYQAPSQEDLIEDFYSVENAAHVSPHGLRKSMDKGHEDFLLVDLRSEEEYEDEHIVGAVNIPAYKDPDTSAYGDRERIVNSFKELKSQNPQKDIIVYCYSTACMTGRKIGGMLSENDIYVKHLGIGWNQWRYEWTSWNHPLEWEKTNASEYIASGKEPGKPEVKVDSTSCPVDNEFGC